MSLMLVSGALTMRRISVTPVVNLLGGPDPSRPDHQRPLQPAAALRRRHRGRGGRGLEVRTLTLGASNRTTATSRTILIAFKSVD